MLEKPELAWLRRVVNPRYLCWPLYLRQAPSMLKNLLASGGKRTACSGATPRRCSAAAIAAANASTSFPSLHTAAFVLMPLTISSSLSWKDIAWLQDGLEARQLEGGGQAQVVGGESPTAVGDRQGRRAAGVQVLALLRTLAHDPTRTFVGHLPCRPRLAWPGWPGWSHLCDQIAVAPRAGRCREQQLICESNFEGHCKRWKRVALQ